MLSCLTKTHCSKRIFLTKRKMSTTPKLKYPKPIVVGPLGKTHHGTVIFAHGLGDSAAGWADGCGYLATLAPNIKFILPSAASIPITINFGMKMPGWYDIKSLNKDGESDVEGLEETRAYLNKLVEDEMAESGIGSESIILAGFSQGAGLLSEKKFGGIIGMSCYLARHKEFASLINANNAKTPILMCHGTSDATVAYAWGDMSYKALSSMGCDVEMKSYKGLQHSASDTELKDVASFISKCLPGQKGSL